MREYVRVPRAVAADYWNQPWSAVVAAAEAKADGLVVKGPKWTPWRSDTPRVEQYTDVRTGEVQQKRFDDDLAAWREEQETCFLYEAEGRTWPKNKTLLFQQNW